MHGRHGVDTVFAASRNLVTFAVEKLRCKLRERVGNNNDQCCEVRQRRVFGGGILNFSAVLL
jgi:hypothetical protein